MIEIEKSNESILVVMLKGILGGGVTLLILMGFNKLYSFLIPLEIVHNSSYVYVYLSLIIICLVSVLIPIGILHLLKSEDTLKYNFSRYTIFISAYILAFIFWAILALYIAVKLFDFQFLTW